MYIKSLCIYIIYIYILKGQTTSGVGGKSKKKTTRASTNVGTGGNSTAVSTSASVKLHIYEPNWKTETLHLGIFM